MHFCFFPPCTKWSTITPQTVRCQHEIPSFASALKTAWLLVMPATHQCLHKIHFSHGGPETLLNTAPILLSTVRQSHDKSYWLNRASLAASQWTGINWIKSGLVAELCHYVISKDNVGTFHIMQVNDRTHFKYLKHVLKIYMWTVFFNRLFQIKNISCLDI